MSKAKAFLLCAFFAWNLVCFVFPPYIGTTSVENRIEIGRYPIWDVPNQLPDSTSAFRKIRHIRVDTTMLFITWVNGASVLGIIGALSCIRR